MPKAIPRAPKKVVSKSGRTNPKVDFDVLLPSVIEILHQHPMGIRLYRLFECLEQIYKNGCFYIEGRPLHKGSGYRRVRTEILTVLQQFAILSTKGENGSGLLLILNKDIRVITQLQLDSVLKFAKECSNSQAAEPRIAAKIKKVFEMYPKICRKLDDEAGERL